MKNKQCVSGVDFWGNCAAEKCVCTQEFEQSEATRCRAEGGDGAPESPAVEVGVDLPPLPEPDHALDCGMQPFYRPDQMQEYARVAILSDREIRGKPLACMSEPGAWSECQMKTIDAYNAIQRPRAAVALNRAQQGEVTVTDYGNPVDNLAQQGEPVARLDLLIQVDNLCSQIENTLYAFRGDDEAVEQAMGAIEHAKKVAAPYRTYRIATKEAAPADAPTYVPEYKTITDHNGRVTGVAWVNSDQRPPVGAPVEDAQEQPQGERRDEFEQAMKAKGHRTERADNGEYVGVTSYRWEGWSELAKKIGGG